MPGFSPGSADRNQLKQAVKKSDSDLVERTMLEDKIRATGESILIFFKRKHRKKSSKRHPYFNLQRKIFTFLRISLENAGR